MKQCVNCKDFKPETEFDVRKGPFTNNRCKVCRRQRGNAYKAERRKNPEYRKKEKQDSRNQYEKTITQMTQAYVDEHGSMPLCACGCGGTVTMDVTESRKPFKYLKFHHAQEEEINQIRSAAMKQYFAAKRVDSKLVANMLRKYKDDHNMTWQQIADKIPLSRRHLRSLIDGAHTGCSKEFTEYIVKRLNDIPTEMQYTKLRKTIMDKQSKDAMSYGRIYGLMVVKNEADRYLQAALEWNTQIFDDLLIVDDNSTDDTLDVCYGYTSNIIRKPDTVPGFIEHEGQFRQYAWESAARLFGLTEDDWVYAPDADEFFVSNGPGVTPRDAIDQYREAAMAVGKRGVMFQIPEMWDFRLGVQESGLMMRVDGLWNNNKGIRLARYNPVWNYSKKKMGCYSVPIEYMSAENRLDDADFGKLLHFGYIDPADRKAKHIRYNSLSDHGHNKAHINSIMATPRLEEWKGGTPVFWKGIYDE